MDEQREVEVLLQGPGPYPPQRLRIKIEGEDLPATIDWKLINAGDSPTGRGPRRESIHTWVRDGSDQDGTPIYRRL